MKSMAAILALALSTTLVAGGCGRPPQSESGSVRVGSFDVPYITEGEGRPCLVLGSRLYHSKIFSADFKSKLRCTFVDIRVFIPQAPVDTLAPYTIEVAVDDIEAVRKALSMPRMVLVGHSITGAMAIAYARKYPDNVSHVIVIGAPPGWTKPYVAFMDSFWKATASPGRQELYRKNWTALTPDSLSRLTPIAGFVAGAQADAPQRWFDSTYNDSHLWPGAELNPTALSQLFDLSREYDLFRDTTKIVPPVFLAIGRYDFYGGAPRSVWEGRKGMFEDLTIRGFDRSGHTPQLEEAAAFDAAVFEWLDGVRDAEPSQSSTEHQRLGFWVGTWKIEAEAKPNPMFPAGNYAATMTGEWFEGKFHVVCRFKWTGAMGPYTELEIFGYDSESKSYYAYDIDGMGTGSVGAGTVEGKTWTYVFEMRVGGKPMRLRWKVVEASPTMITWTSEVSESGGPWILAGQAEAIKETKDKQEK